MNSTILTTFETTRTTREEARIASLTSSNVPTEYTLSLNITSE